MARICHLDAIHLAQTQSVDLVRRHPGRSEEAHEPGIDRGAVRQRTTSRRCAWPRPIPFAQVLLEARPAGHELSVVGFERAGAQPALGSAGHVRWKAQRTPPGAAIRMPGWTPLGGQLRQHQSDNHGGARQTRVELLVEQAVT
jgi:hypothetical protein